jgi:hypothetical protein
LRLVDISGSLKEMLLGLQVTAHLATILNKGYLLLLLDKENGHYAIARTWA